ncbi:MAG: aspartate--tRNA ligase, partial [Deltaproteobacteria bacterium]|nr:aspartate--tRNA ligase [Deltaproteobacteria bacterium]
LMLRSKLYHCIRNHFAEHGFVEIETPLLVRYTPGGARNFLVPSRLHPGSFYALAESPQLFKQLLMVAGFDRYVQIVKCFRDEDLRGDRQPEFTQIDVEMSFVSEDDIFEVIEELIVKVWREVLGVDLERDYPPVRGNDGITRRFPRLSYAESMRRFGNDKPDMRFGLEHVDLTNLLIDHRGGGIPPLQAIASKFEEGLYRRDLPEEILKAIRIPKNLAQTVSRSELERLEELVRSMGSQGLARAKVGAGGSWQQSPWARFAEASFVAAVNAACQAEEGDLLLFQFGKESLVQTVMSHLRLHLGKRLGLIPPVGARTPTPPQGQWSFLWVVSPPLFERGEDGLSWVAAHHPFTRPHDACLPYLES